LAVADDRGANFLPQLNLQHVPWKIVITDADRIYCNDFVAYLRDLFTRLPSAKITEIQEFTPAAWAGAKAKEKLGAQAT
jgi:hypothetical protein